MDGFRVLMALLPTNELVRTLPRAHRQRYSCEMCKSNHLAFSRGLREVFDYWEIQGWKVRSVELNVLAVVARRSNHGHMRPWCILAQ